MSPEEIALVEPVPRRGKRLWIFAVVLLLLAIAAACWFLDYDRLQDRLPASGGLYFPWKVQLPVANFRQSDKNWKDDQLGSTDATLGQEGCAVASSAMVLSFYGIDTDPGRLNAFLKTNEGYTEQGWIYWEKAAELAPEKVRHVYEASASHRLIDFNLLQGNPVIVKLRHPSGMNHFVVIVGKSGFDYLITDPGAGSEKGVYPLKEFGSPVLGLRFYSKLPLGPG